MVGCFYYQKKSTVAAAAGHTPQTEAGGSTLNQYKTAEYDQLSKAGEGHDTSNSGVMDSTPADKAGYTSKLDAYASSAPVFIPLTHQDDGQQDKTQQRTERKSKQRRRYERTEEGSAAAPAM